MQSQQPNALDFQKHYDIVVSGQVYHRSRTCTMLNEQPIYIAWTSSSYGYVGRSVYQRCLFPLKSFVQSMVTDDMVTKKAGVLIAKMAQPGSIIDNPVIQFFAGKRQLLKEAENGNVISVAPDEAIETLNMQNIDGAFGMARKDILENIAVSADMPAKLLNAETFAEGFGEGTEDAKNVARYIDRTRIEMQPLYDYFDPIVMRRAWNPDFYKSIQADFPDEYGSRTYEDAFYAWKNSFATTWPSLLTEPDSEKARTDEVRLKALIAAIQVLVPELDPENKATVIQWAQDNMNENKFMFTSPLMLDIDALKNYVPPVAAEGGEGGEPKPGHPFAMQDSEPRAPRRLRAAT